MKHEIQVWGLRTRGRGVKKWFYQHINSITPRLRRAKRRAPRTTIPPKVIPLIPLIPLIPPSSSLRSRGVNEWFYQHINSITPRLRRAKRRAPRTTTPPKVIPLIPPSSSLRSRGVKEWFYQHINSITPRLRRAKRRAPRTTISPLQRAAKQQLYCLLSSCFCCLKKFPKFPKFPRFPRFPRFPSHPKASQFGHFINKAYSRRKNNNLEVTIVHYALCIVNCALIKIRACEAFRHR